MYTFVFLVVGNISYGVIQVRKTRNFLMHSSTVQLSPSELSDVLQPMTDMLSDLWQRHHDRDIQTTLNDIQQVVIITASCKTNKCLILMFIL